MDTQEKKVPQKLIFEEATGDYILLEDGTKLYFKKKPTDYRFDKSLYTGTVQNEKTGEIEFVKFIEIQDYEAPEDRWRGQNLIREGDFQFYYPFIAYVYGNFYGTAVGHLPNETIEKQVFGVRMEYVEGMDVAHYWKEMHEKLKQQTVTWEEIEKQTFKHMRQLLYGMRYYTEYAYPLCYLTRDLNPKNVMIDKYGNVKIIDFDFAHISESDATKKNDPDHALAKFDGFTDPRTVRDREFDIQSEIYEAGKTLFYWINGKLYYNLVERNLYYDKDQEPLAYGNDIERYALRYQEDCYKELRTILGKMCAEPEGRYKCVSEIIKDFEAFLENYYSGEQELEEMQCWNQMPLLQTRKTGRRKKSVGYKICKMGASVCSNPLAEYALRPILVETKEHGKKKLMNVYMIDNRIYYIPAMGVNLKRVRVGEDYEILDGDEFIAEGIKFKFLL